jgi:RNA polymerase sigma-54 factor
LERSIDHEQTENPALEVTEQRVCLFCSTPLYGPSCSVCQRPVPNTQPLIFSHEHSAPFETHRYTEQPQIFFDIDNYSFTEADSDEDQDTFARISLGETLAEELLQQLEAIVSPDDAAIAEQLVGNLNEHGYLEIDPEEIAQQLQVPSQRVTYVLSQLQTLEPLGIGARDARECLLLQLQVISEQHPPHPLAATLIENHLHQLGRNQFTEIARQLRVKEQEVRQAYSYIRSMLHPFPTYLYHATTSDSRLGNSATYIRPDIIIRKGETGFEVELMEEKRYQFHVGTQYTETLPTLSAGRTSSDIQHYMFQHRDRAKFFVDCVQRRWRTLRGVAEYIVSYQHDFLEKGIRSLRPLTRAEVAHHLHLDEGTVSRTTANKYALLPNGRLIPLADFFDGSLGIKDILRELIQTEQPHHRLSDEELARMLTARGIPLARRTITKYREEMGIGSSRERNN